MLLPAPVRANSHALPGHFRTYLRAAHHRLRVTLGADWVQPVWIISWKQRRCHSTELNCQSSCGKSNPWASLTCFCFFLVSHASVGLKFQMRCLINRFLKKRAGVFWIYNPIWKLGLILEYTREEKASSVSDYHSFTFYSKTKCCHCSPGISAPCASVWLRGKKRDRCFHCPPGVNKDINKSYRILNEPRLASVCFTQGHPFSDCHQKQESSSNHWALICSWLTIGKR